jgi:hypothetical protein
MTTRKELLNELRTDHQFRSTWRNLIDDGTLDKIIMFCECHRAPYQSDLPDHPEPHLQSEKNGGIKAWDKLVYLIRTMPFNTSDNGPGGNKNASEFVRDASLPTVRERFKSK